MKVGFLFGEQKPRVLDGSENVPPAFKERLTLDAREGAMAVAGLEAGEIANNHGGVRQA